MCAPTPCSNSSTLPLAPGASTPAGPDGATPNSCTLGVPSPVACTKRIPPTLTDTRKSGAGSEYPVELVQRTVTRLSTPVRTTSGEMTSMVGFRAATFTGMAGALTTRAPVFTALATFTSQVPSADARSNSVVSSVELATWVSVPLTIVDPQTSCATLVEMNPVPVTFTAVGAGDPESTELGDDDRIDCPGAVACTVTETCAAPLFRRTTKR